MSEQKDSINVFITESQKIVSKSGHDLSKVYSLLGEVKHRLYQGSSKAVEEGKELGNAVAIERLGNMTTRLFQIYHELHEMADKIKELDSLQLVE
jgi:hypothetical protein